MTPNQSDPILICGPTACGKSALALRLAEALDAIVVNADALQVYDCWRVLSARPAPADEARAEHVLYGHVACHAPYSVGQWLREVEPLLSAGRRLIVTGGTGLYFNALTKGLNEIPETPADIRAEGNRLMETKGISYFRDYLAQHDPKICARIDLNNGMRLQRAWEVHRLTGRPLSDWQAEPASPLVVPASAVRILLGGPVHWLDARIARRFDVMMAEGALDEVAARRGDWDPKHPSAKALGAKELMAHLEGALALGDAVARAKLATRQFAKRQRTWFRSNMKDWNGIDLAETSEVDAYNRIISML